MQSHRLRRSRRNRWLVGVCGGFGERYGFPPLILRLALIAAGIFFTIPAVFAYLIAWLFIPAEPEDFEPWPPPEDSEEGDEPGWTEEPSGELGSADAPESSAPPQQGDETPSDPWSREDRSSF